MPFRLRFGALFATEERCICKQHGPFSSRDRHKTLKLLVYVFKNVTIGRHPLAKARFLPRKRTYRVLSATAVVYCDANDGGALDRLIARMYCYSLWAATEVYNLITELTVILV